MRRATEPVASDAELPVIRNATADALAGMTDVAAGRDPAQWQKWWADAQKLREVA